MSNVPISARERLIVIDHAGAVLQGEHGAEHLVKRVRADGTVEVYEGEAGHERLVRIEQRGITHSPPFNLLLEMARAWDPSKSLRLEGATDDVWVAPTIEGQETTASVFGAGVGL